VNSSLLRSALLVASCCYIIAAHAEEKTLKLKQAIPLPGVEGRIDHFALDASGERLFVCALGNNTVEVLDLRKGKRVRSITASVHRKESFTSLNSIAFLLQMTRLGFSKSMTENRSSRLAN
jgi:hypothetical protein